MKPITMTVRQWTVLASIPDVNPALRRIRFDPDGAAVTNGHVLVQVPLPEDEGRCLTVSTPGMLAALSHFASVEPVTMRVNGDSVRMCGSDGESYAVNNPWCDMPFPKKVGDRGYDKYIGRAASPIEPDATSIQPRYLRLVGDVMEAFSTDCVGAVRMMSAVVDNAVVFELGPSAGDVCQFSGLRVAVMQVRR